MWALHKDCICSMVLKRSFLCSFVSSWSKFGCFKVANVGISFSIGRIASRPKNAMVGDILMVSCWADRKSHATPLTCLCHSPGCSWAHFLKAGQSMRVIWFNDAHVALNLTVSFGILAAILTCLMPQALQSNENFAPNSPPQSVTTSNTPGYLCKISVCKKSATSSESTPFNFDPFKGRASTNLVIEATATAIYQYFWGPDPSKGPQRSTWVQNQGAVGGVGKISLSSLGVAPPFSFWQTSHVLTNSLTNLVNCGNQ
jgi:hypothetical protein